MNPSLLSALEYWQVAFQYLDLSEKVATLIYESGNKYMLVQEGDIKDYDPAKLDEEFKEATKWSDIHHSLPVLFNFYHGVEVLLKGFTAASNELKTGHNLTSLFETVETTHEGEEFLSILKKYIDSESLPEVLKKFMLGSSPTIDDWYEALKYPEARSGYKFAHQELRNLGAIGADFYDGLAQDIHQIRISAVSYVKRTYPEIA